MTTVAEALAAAAARLNGAGIDSARLDARALLAHVLGVETTTLFSRPERVLTATEAVRFETAVARRVGREPLSHITGWREFWSLPFRVTADTLDPRADTETVVEAVLQLVPVRHKPLRLLDLGTGTGCILLSLLHELPHATGVGIDASEAACAVARDNASRLGLDERVSIVLGDWGSGLDGCFDVIVSNPPYIPVAETATLQPEVALFEPRSALAAGDDGLDCYRAIAPQLPRLLSDGGHVVFEVGRGQAAPVAGIVAAVGLEVIGTRTDLAGVERCVLARHGAPCTAAKKNVGNHRVPD